LEKQAQAAREKLAGLRVENSNLKNGMDELKSRIEKLAAAQGVLCPLCGQSLSPEHRLATLEQLNAEGTQLGDRWRVNKSAMEELAIQTTDYENQITKSASADSDRLSASRGIAQLSERLESLQNNPAIGSRLEQNGSRKSRNCLARANLPWRPAGNW